MPESIRKAVRPRVAFVLSVTSRVPIGGYKVFYEYANALVADGFEVQVVHSFVDRGWPRPFSWRGLTDWGKVCLRSVWHRLRGWQHSPPWFDLDGRVQFRMVWSLDERHLPSADVYCFSEAAFVARANRYRRIPASRIVHFVQGHETWALPPAELAELYRSPMKKIAVSDWLRREVEKAGGHATVIPNGFDFNKFRMVTPPGKRDAHVVGMLFHPAQVKDVETGFRALELAHARDPGLKVRLFGAFSMDRRLPPWMTHCHNPTQAQLLDFYNEIAIFLGTSRQEGWGLPVGEAMACGAAVVCTDNGGYAEMAADGKTARVVPVGDAERMAEALLELIRDDDLRIRLALAGHRHISAFTWKRSVRLLEEQLLEICGVDGASHP
ncbi:MAG: glycosyltransferase family 4 protein [Kiritimatiellae bacterium]|nr:glycosyltransferase family 4 protein [Kiritimatiellia bacterium]